MATPFHTTNLLYSGSYDNVITKEKDIDLWEAQILNILTRIAQTRAGQALFIAIRHCPRITLIMPDPESHLNANAAATRWETAAYAGTADVSKPATLDTEAAAGSSNLVHFSAQNFVDVDGVGASRDAILFHELCHSVHQMTGRCMDGWAMANGYDNLEEFWAILVTNIYLSERRQTLRGDHQGFLPLDYRLQDSRAFLAWAPVTIRAVCLSAPAFTRSLAHVPAAFNPIREHYRKKPGGV